VTALGVERPLVSNGAVAASVNGTRISFRSADVALRPSAEAFASALWLPALHADRDLEIDAPLDPSFVDNLNAFAAVAHEWWGYQPRRIRSAGRRTLEPPPTVHATALCFTGGVDSFYSLLRTPPTPDVLVYVVGYDVSLAEPARAGIVESHVRAVADAVGARAVVIHSDLRQHPVVAALNWEWAHGGALAAVGHLLADVVGTTRISSTFDLADDRPWGSHRRTDPLFSAADARIEHVGVEIPRDEKLAAMCHEPLVQQHLRVCWEHLTDDLNCGQCDKCVITMVELDLCGALDAVATMPGSDGLVDRIDALATTRYLKTYRRLLADQLHGAPAAAIGRLLQRSGDVWDPPRTAAPEGARRSWRREITRRLGRQPRR
jgi:hypothetical protein